jgi:hypothetical protein
MLLLNAPLAMEVVFEELNVGLVLLRLREELIIGRNGRRACLHLSQSRRITSTPRITVRNRLRNSETYLFDDALPCADGGPILELVLRKVELGPGYFRPMLNLIHRSLELCQAFNHGG